VKTTQSVITITAKQYYVIPKKYCKQIEIMSVNIMLKHLTVRCKLQYEKVL